MKKVLKNEAVYQKIKYMIAAHCYEPGLRPNVEKITRDPDRVDHIKDLLRSEDERREMVKRLKANAPFLKGAKKVTNLKQEY